jgi:hypothetical protein
MESSRSKQEVLAEAIPGLVVLRYRAQEGQKSAVCVGCPQFFDSINTQGPFFG